MLVDRCLGTLFVALLAVGCGSDSSGDGAAGSAGSGAAGGAAGAAGAGGAAGAAGAPVIEPDPDDLPTATGPCPEFTQGKLSFSPDGKPRDVEIHIGDEAKDKDGPLVFYWHGTGSAPVEAQAGLGNKVIDEIKALGGIVAAPYHDPASGILPWYQYAGIGKMDDQRVADEVLACAIEKVGVDLRHIHSSGMSAGGLQTVQLAYRRPGWIASVVPYSGGLIGTPPKDTNPDNKYPVMIFYGGAGDEAFTVKFKETSLAYGADLAKKKHFFFYCDHGTGHTIPPGAQDSLLKFFLDHPYGTDPSPYADGLPDGFPSYCSIP